MYQRVIINIPWHISIWYSINNYYFHDLFPWDIKQTYFHQYSMTSPTKSSWKSWWTPWNLHENPSNFRKVKHPHEKPDEITMVSWNIHGEIPWKSTIFHAFFQGTMSSIALARPAAKAACHFLALWQADMALVRPGPRWDKNYGHHRMRPPR